MSHRDKTDDSQDARDHRPVHLNLGTGNLREWRTKRAEKSLYELQIEVCEKALEQLALKKDVSAIGRAKIENELREEIEHLKKTKKPLFFRPWWEIDFFDAKWAQKIRDQVAEEAKNKGASG